MDARSKRLSSMLAVAALTIAATLLPAGAARADRIATIERIRASVVAIGTLQRTRTPQFQFLGTGFAVGDGSFVVTNAHVVPPVLDVAHGETLAIMLPNRASEVKEEAHVRDGKPVSVDTNVDLALIKISGPPLQPLKVRDSDTVREGQEVLFTGFPIGSVLGPYPATHGGMVSVVTPIAIPQGRAADLDPRTLRRLSSGSFPVFQLDATAYPGNSGSPVYDPESGEVVGIINMVLVKGTKETALSQPSGISYAVPSKHLQALIEKAR
jgi:S1-C subfamily serine protease